MRSRYTDSPDVTALVVALCFFVLVSSSLALLWPSIPTSWHIKSEGGPIETLSAILWGAAAGACLLSALQGKGSRTDFLLLAMLFLACTVRELDFQKRFSEWNLGKPANYLDPDIAVQQRLLGFTLYLLPLLSVVCLVLFRGTGRFVEALRRGRSWAKVSLVWAAMFGLTLVLDKAHKLGELPDAIRHLPHLFEEVLEAAIALIAAVWMGLLWVRALGARQHSRASAVVKISEG